ncbi:hypothetical protein HMPREF9966_0670 [Streptococcus anginosus SK52 = DSM 20563]|nr:hypothetical protein HMPREF9966_0670 [Streptococcus anginosus SK52 = DSM 20563]
MSGLHNKIRNTDRTKPQITFYSMTETRGKLKLILFVD